MRNARLAFLAVLGVASLLVLSVGGCSSNQSSLKQIQDQNDANNRALALEEKEHPVNVQDVIAQRTRGIQNSPLPAAAKAQAIANMTARTEAYYGNQK